MRSGSKGKRSQTRQQSRYDQANQTAESTASTASATTVFNSSCASSYSGTSHAHESTARSSPSVTTTSSYHVQQVNGDSKVVMSNVNNINNNNGPPIIQLPPPVSSDEKKSNSAGSAAHHGPCKLPKKRKFDPAEYEGMQNDEKSGANKVVLVCSASSTFSRNSSNTNVSGATVVSSSTAQFAGNKDYSIHHHHHAHPVAVQVLEPGVEDLRVANFKASDCINDSARQCPSGVSSEVYKPIDMRSLPHKAVEIPVSHVQSQPLSLVSANKVQNVILGNVSQYNNNSSSNSHGLSDLVSTIPSSSIITAASNSLSNSAHSNNLIQTKCVAFINSNDKTVSVMSQPYQQQQQQHQLEKQQQEILHQLQGQQHLLIKDNSVQVGLKNALSKSILISPNSNLSAAYPASKLSHSSNLGGSTSSPGIITSAVAFSQIQSGEQFTISADEGARISTPSSSVPNSVATIVHTPTLYHINQNSQLIPQQIIVGDKAQQTYHHTVDKESCLSSQYIVQQANKDISKIPLQTQLVSHSQQQPITRPIPVQPIRTQLQTSAQQQHVSNNNSMSQQQQSLLQQKPSLLRVQSISVPQQHPQQQTQQQHYVAVSSGLVIAASDAMPATNAILDARIVAQLPSSEDSKRHLQSTELYRSEGASVRNSTEMRVVSNTPDHWNGGTTHQPQQQQTVTSTRVPIDLTDWRGHRVLAKKNCLFYPAVISSIRNGCDLIVRLDNTPGKELLYVNAFSSAGCKYDVISDSVPGVQQLVEGVRIVARLDREKQVFVEAEIVERKFTTTGIVYVIRTLQKNPSDTSSDEQHHLLRPHLRLLQPPWWEDLEVLNNSLSSTQGLSSSLQQQQQQHSSSHHPTKAYNSQTGYEPQPNQASTEASFSSTASFGGSSNSPQVQQGHPNSASLMSGGSASVDDLRRRQPDEYDSEDDLRREDITFPNEAGSYY